MELISSLSDDYVIFQDPTPGYQNNTPESSGILSDPLIFSHDGGNLSKPNKPFEITG